MTKQGTDGSGNNWGDHLLLRLSDGSVYPYEGRIAQVNHGMDGSSGSIIVKAVFDNPENLLIPGLYATVISDTRIQRSALSVPQRAVQQTLGKYYVSVIDGNGQAQTREVTPGQKSVSSGSSPADFKAAMSSSSTAIRKPKELRWTSTC